VRPLIRQILVLLPLLAACQGIAPRQDTPTAAGLEETYRQAARLRGQALAAIDASDWEHAIALLRELEHLLPDNILAPLNLALCLREAGDEAGALEAARRARLLAPDNPALLYALASIHRDAGDRSAWEAVLAEYVATQPRDPRPYYLETRWHEEDGDREEAYAAAVRAVDRDPENLVLLVDRLVTAAAALRLEETGDALDAIEDRLGGFEGPLARYAEEIRQRVDSADAAALPPRAQIVRNILRPTELYRQHLLPLAGSGGGGRGFFVQLDFDPPLPKSIQGGQDIDFELVDREVELRAVAARARGPLWLDSGPVADAVLVSTTDGEARLRWTAGGWQSELVAEAGALDRLWSHLDVDQDGAPDRLIEQSGRLVLESSSGAPPQTIITLDGPLSAVFPLDIDHDGDLDILASRATGTLYLQNNGNGSWSTVDTLLGELATEEVSDLALADFDDDGDLDLAAAVGGGLRLLSNLRLDRLRDETAARGLAAGPRAARRLAVQDFDANGSFDILSWSEDGAHLYLNSDGQFEDAPLPTASAGGWTAAAVADFDNDGDHDVLAVAIDGSALLLRNRRPGFAAEPMPSMGAGVEELLAGDYDGDGDLDLLSRSATGLGYWRNDGASLNHWLRVQLRGRNEGNSKNNSQGLFVRLELRIGASYQTAIGNGGVNHLGLGAHRQVDVLRVLWTNGLSQTWAALAADQALDEEQVLKGSCPFLYAWNGSRFEFVTDLMWNSPLGMSLGDGSPAPHESARDFVLIPGDRLAPAGGDLWLQVTEELWETVYVDRQKLLAIDRPAAFDLVVDEKFTPPPHPLEPPLLWVDTWQRPVAARDHAGRDVLDRILRRDEEYVGDLPLTRFQGVTREHALELDFAGAPAGTNVTLVLWGWTFPTDTSINFALAQGALPAPSPPRLEMATGSGWRTLRPSISFPSGKRKAVVVRLPEPLPTGTATLRLTTDMQIYWDAAALAIGEPQVEPTITVLEPRLADLHQRGFSRLYRTADSAPHLFDYETVSTGPRFRDLAGLYTRFGPVTELLAAADDRYAVMNAGDELTIRYPADELPELPAGWRRDYVLYTDGWVKDGDIHTAHSQTVEPLPYHSMNAYPNLPRHDFPRDPEHEAWLTEFQTRQVDDQPFRHLLQGHDPE
jgi:tetratricopeptide (TPR) repeat protein